MWLQRLDPSVIRYVAQNGELCRLHRRRCSVERLSRRKGEDQAGGSRPRYSFSAGWKTYFFLRRWLESVYLLEANRYSTGPIDDTFDGEHANGWRSSSSSSIRARRGRWWYRCTPQHRYTRVRQAPSLGTYEWKSCCMNTGRNCASLKRCTAGVRSD